jgi:hypothetical protein
MTRLSYLKKKFLVVIYFLCDEYQYHNSILNFHHAFLLQNIEAKTFTNDNNNHITNEVKTPSPNDQNSEDANENGLENIMAAIEPPEFQIDQAAIKALLETVAIETQTWALDRICHLRAEMLTIVHDNRMMWSKEQLLQVR